MRKREIKFRGKRKMDNKWLYGSLVEVDGSRYIVGEGDFRCPGGCLEHVIADKEQEVQGDTVGQLTGLRDAKGREIYEGDIFRAPYVTPLRPGEKDNSTFCSVRWDEESGIWRLVTHPFGNMENLCRYLRCGEVAGNVYDNAELLDSTRIKYAIYYTRSGRKSVVYEDNFGMGFDTEEEACKQLWKMMCERYAEDSCITHFAGWELHEFGEEFCEEADPEGWEKMTDDERKDAIRDWVEQQKWFKGEGLYDCENWRDPENIEVIMLKGEGCFVEDVHHYMVDEYEIEEED